MFFSYIFPLEGNFDIDAGDGMGGGDHLGQTIPKITKKHNVRKLFTLLGHFSKKRKNISLIYKDIEKDTESDKRNKNNNL